MHKKNVSAACCPPRLGIPAAAGKHWKNFWTCFCFEWVSLFLQARAHSLLKGKEAELKTAADSVRQTYEDQLSEAEASAAEARSVADQVRPALDLHSHDTAHRLCSGKWE